MCPSLLISADEKPILDKGGAYSSTTTTPGGTYTQHYHKEGHIHSTTTRRDIYTELPQGGTYTQHYHKEGALPQGGTYTQHYHKERHIHSTTTRSMITNALYLYTTTIV